ncbi:Hypothetical predicted protein [Mytilus galloprovincialis]|uniref:Uncharacterized protein n=1 Tax=Mytilus galloprovincialis TaxID=29158 RepID=A0A8B6HP43_MYTGA|nr:Hypothetical predicted protein [Mytilus galloprovincialis]
MPSAYGKRKCTDITKELSNKKRKHNLEQREYDSKIWRRVKIAPQERQHAYCKCQKNYFNKKDLLSFVKAVPFLNDQCGKHMPSSPIFNATLGVHILVECIDDLCATEASTVPISPDIWEMENENSQ